MANFEENEFFDVYNLELQLREKINDLHWKTVTLEETQKELSETRRSLYENQTQLEDQRRISRQLEMQLQSALETTKRLEADKIQDLAHRVRIQTNIETTETEREVMIDQSRAAKLENMELKIKIQEMEASLENSKMIKETLENSIVELKNFATRLHTNLQGNKNKLEHEQEQLRKSAKDSMQFGRRVLGLLKTSHIARERDKKKIKELEKLVTDLSACEASGQPPISTEDPDMGTLHLKMAMTLKELRSKLEDNTLDEKLSLMCNELRQISERIVKD